jgi:hypothetical protein
MNGKFKETVTRIEPFTHKVRKFDKGIHEHRITPGHWQVNKEMSKGRFSDFRTKIDKYGVKEVDYSDLSGSRYHLKRIQVIIPIDTKKEYYQKRMNDKSLTVAQREFAKKRLKDL